MDASHSRGSATLTPTALTFALALAACGTATASDPPLPPHPTLRALYHIPRIADVRPRTTALVLVDFQQEFFVGRLPLPDGAAARTQAERLLRWARHARMLVVHVRNEQPAGAALFASDSPTVAFAPTLMPGESELVITKRGGGAFTRTELAGELHRRGVTTIIVAGLMTHLAVAMTAQDGSVQGFDVIVAGDATATRELPGVLGRHSVDEVTLREATLAAIADRFADVLATDEILAR